MNRADSRIIRENPDKSDYELQMLGVSEDGIIEHQTKRGDLIVATKEVQAVKPVVVEDAAKAAITVTATTKHIRPMQPVLSDPISFNDAGVILYNNDTGKGTPMARGAAERMARKYPKEFKII